MPRRRRRTSTPLGAFAELAAAGVATAVTLSVRLPQLAAGTLSAAEATRMVAEKAAAAGEGLLAGSAVAARIAAERALRPAPHRALEDAMAVVEAASRPARRRVKANARRLSSKPR